MTAVGDSLGWDWWPAESAPVQSEPQDLAKACLRLLSSADGVLVMDHLRSVTLNRCLGADASDQALRMLEGQRNIVLHLLSLAEQGRSLPSA